MSFNLPVTFLLLIGAFFAIIGIIAMGAREWRMAGLCIGLFLLMALSGVAVATLTPAP